MSTAPFAYTPRFSSRPVMRHSPEADGCVFENAPPSGMQWRLGLIGPGKPGVGRRVVLFVTIGWLPLVVFTLLQTLASGGGDQIVSLFRSIETHARFLIVGPLLIFAEAQCAPALGAVMRHFADSGLVPPREHKRLENAIATTRRFVESTAAEVMALALAYLVVIAIAWSSVHRLPVWHKTADAALSLAGWWHVLVSMPLLLVLFFGWIWRLVLWGRLLWRVSRLDLQLIASHADGAGGLGFLGYSLRAFSSVGLAFATIAAARSAGNVLRGQDLLMPHFYFNIGTVVVVALLFTAPLLAFTPNLVNAWRHGIFEYGALAARMGSVFERKWFGRGTIDDSALSQQDFSATTDLYQIVSNVHRMRFIPIGLKDVGVLAGAMLLPFIPVMLFAIPPDVILAGLKGLLL